MKAPLDYESPYDKPVKPRKEKRSRGLIPSNLRIAYWFIMLAAIGTLLWYIQHLLSPYNDLAK